MDAKIDAHIHEQARATRALVKFCDDHGCTSQWLDDVRKCSAALEREDVVAAVQSYQRVPLGGNGCFNDWFPPAIFENENGEYAWTVFEALCTQWSCMMSLSA